MNKEKELLIDLLCQSQFGPIKDLSFDGISMNYLFNEAAAQSVLGLVANEIPEYLLDNNWREALYKQKAQYIRYCHAEKELGLVLEKASINYVVIKGNSAAVNYKNPSLRSMGDIDILVPVSFYEKAKSVLEDYGYLKGHDDGRNSLFTKDGIKIEVHHHYSTDIDIEAYISKGILNSEIDIIDNHSFPVLPALANGLIFLDHMRWHLKSGLGLRQVMDWMVYVDRYLDDRLWASDFESIVTEKGMYTFAITITRMCQLYLGLSKSIKWCFKADESLCHRLMDNLLSSGNFGRRNGKGNYVEYVRLGIQRDGFFTWMQNRGEENWSLYSRFHWLRPFCWIYQLFRYFKQGILSGRKKKLLIEDFSRGKDKYDLLKDLGLE